MLHFADTMIGSGQSCCRVMAEPLRNRLTIKRWDCGQIRAIGGATINRQQYSVHILLVLSGKSETRLLFDDEAVWC